MFQLLAKKFKCRNFLKARDQEPDILYRGPQMHPKNEMRIQKSKLAF